MAGGAGNNLYDYETGDSITELPGGGTDTMRSATSNLELPAEVENGTLLGTLELGAKGNALNNVIIGSDGINRLDGGDGNDSMSGAGGNEKLRGENGSDTLNGGTGEDKLDGGAGNNLYFVDSANDEAVEAASSGTNDVVSSLVSWTLGANFETLILTGGSPINGTGNTLANVLTGNNMSNSPSGGEGNDTLNGGAGSFRPGRIRRCRPAN